MGSVAQLLPRQPGGRTSGAGRRRQKLLSCSKQWQAGRLVGWEAGRQAGHAGEDTALTKAFLPALVIKDFVFHPERENVQVKKDHW